MRNEKRWRSNLLLAGALAGIPLAGLGAEPYLFELLDRPAYRKAWDALFAGEPAVDAWLARYAKTRNGPANAGETLTLDARTYRVNAVCKTHDCGDNRFVVVFAPDGTRAWGLLDKAGANARYFGKPDAAMQGALRAALR